MTDATDVVGMNMLINVEYSSDKPVPLHFGSVVFITLTSHVRGPGFESKWNQKLL